MGKVSVLEVSSIRNQSVELFTGTKKYVATGDVDEQAIETFTEITYNNRPSRANIEVKLGQVLFARMKGTNKVIQIDESNQDYIYSTGFCVLEPSELVTADYLRVFLKSDLFQIQKDKHSKGATQKAINNEGISKIKIPLPPLEIQKKIVEALDKAQALIDARKEQIRLMDELVKARFVEMFGDPISNPMRWNIRKFTDVATSRLGKMLDAKKQTGESSYPYLANFNVQWFKVNLDTINTMDFNEKEQIEFALNKGDLLVCEGGEVGRCAIWMGEVKNCYFQKALHRVRCDTKVILPEYLSWVFYYWYQYNRFEDIVGSKSTIAHLTGEKLKGLSLVVPPIYLQNQFKDFIEHTNKLKSEIQNNLNEIITIQQALMQQYFG